VYACGVVTDDRIPQSEGQFFSARELLAGRRDPEGSAYAVIYLSPRDYHRVHTPCAGAVEGFQYVPGELWPVFPAATARIPFLFSRNERLTSLMRTAVGEAAVVMVGAFGVGRMRVVYDEVVTNAGGKDIVERTLTPAAPLGAGDELGRFEMGSTVVLLFPPGTVEWAVEAGQGVRYGERIGRLRGSAGQRI
jgi:phosphatidylserine decarboxylase